MKVGDLVKAYGSHISIGDNNVVRGWESNPTENNFNKAIWVEEGLIGILTEKHGSGVRVLFGTRLVWFTTNQLTVIQK